MQRLLIVDDDLEIRTLLAEQLGRAQFLVSTADGGAEMRRVLEKEHVDLIVLDLSLPGEDGLTLCRNLRARANTPVIMLTARHEPRRRGNTCKLSRQLLIAQPVERQQGYELLNA